MNPTPVALSYSQNVSNPDTNILDTNQLLTTTLLVTPIFTRKEILETIKKYESLIKQMQNHAELITSRERRLVYSHFLENPVLTMPQIRKKTGLADQQVYRAMRWLVDNKYIVQLQKIRGPKKGGPKPILYALPDYTNEEKARGLIEVQRSYSPAYDVVQRLTQRIFEDIKDEEIQYMKVVELAKKHNQGLYFLDLVDMTITELQRKGIKVWK